MSCDYCRNEIMIGKTREYANYCPKCHNWGYLTLDSEYIDGQECRVFVCDHPDCGEKYCVNCSTPLSVGKKKSFIDDNKKYFYDEDKDTIFQKIKHIRDD